MKQVKSRKQVGNFSLAKFIAENYGTDISDEKIIEIANLYKLRPSILVRNYKDISKLINIFKTL